MLANGGWDLIQRLKGCYDVLLMMNDWIRSKHVEQTKNCGIKIDYKNCASRWSLTQYIIEFTNVGSLILF